MIVKNNKELLHYLLMGEYIVDKEGCDIFYLKDNDLIMWGGSEKDQIAYIEFDSSFLHFHSLELAKQYVLSKISERAMKY